MTLCADFIARQHVPVVRREILRDAMPQTQQLRGTTDQELQPARGFEVYGLIACLAIWAFLIVWVTLASGSFNPRSALFLLVLPRAPP